MPKTIIENDDRLACAWYIKYQLDAYALGPMRFQEPVSAKKAVEEAIERFGEAPAEVWPDGAVEQTSEYEYEVTVLN